MEVRLVTKTTGVAEYADKSIDEILVGIARISSSREVNELFTEPHKLLRHCLREGHWSVFAMANLGIEIITSRAIGRELLRHWSLQPQELSQRYKAVSEFEPIEIRAQCTNNRQSSTDIINPVLFKSADDMYTDESRHASEAIEDHLNQTRELYQELIKNGVAKECARMIMPEATQTKIVFNGKVRDWITTLNKRLYKTAQKECREVAEAIRDLFIAECPVISKMLWNFEDAYEIEILERLILDRWGVYDLVKKNNFKRLNLTA
jgi:thymidylate synthase (FAD)